MIYPIGYPSQRPIWHIKNRLLSRMLNIVLTVHNCVCHFICFHDQVKFKKVVWEDCLNYWQVHDCHFIINSQDFWHYILAFDLIAEHIKLSNFLMPQINSTKLTGPYFWDIMSHKIQNVIIKSTEINPVKLHRVDVIFPLVVTHLCWTKAWKLGFQTRKLTQRIYRYLYILKYLC
jgi:hypothetical protein